MDQANQKALEEFEEKLKNDLEKQVEILQKAHETIENNEKREFEIQKTKQDQFYEEELERKKRDIDFKFRQQLEELEDEKSRKIIELETSLKDMSLSQENPDLAKHIQKALTEQKDLEREIEEFNESIEEQKLKRKQISIEIINANKQLIEKEKVKSNDKGARISQLRDKIDRVDSDLVEAEHEYQQLLEENKNIIEEEELDDSDLNERVAFDDDSGHPTQVQGNNVSLNRLAQDISEIKTLIEDTGIGRTRVKDYLLDVEEFRKRAEEGKDVSFDEDNLYLLRDQIRTERVMLKKQQKKIEKEKKKWREDKLILQANPDISSDEKQEILERVKINLEKQIDDLNDKISDLKQKERIIKKRELEESE